MLLWNFRDKDKTKDSARGKAGPGSAEDAKRVGTSNSLLPGSSSIRGGKRASVNLSPRAAFQHVSKPRPVTGSMRLTSTIAKEGELLYATDESGTTYIKQAKVDYIIDEIIAEQQIISDKTMTSALVINVRIYLTAEEFWEKLKIRFDVRPSANVTEPDFLVAKQIVQSRWFGLLRKWLQMTPHDIDDVTLNQIRLFVTQRNIEHPTSVNLIIQHLSTVVEERKRETARINSASSAGVISTATSPVAGSPLSSTLSSSSPPSASPLSPSGSRIGAGVSVTRATGATVLSSMMMSAAAGLASDSSVPRPLIADSVRWIDAQAMHQLPPLEIARQLCIAESELFSRVRSSEFLNTAWMRSNRDELAPNIVALTHRFNTLSNWASVSILNPHSPDRIRVMEWFIALEEELVRLQNISTALAIHSALDSRQISRLKNLWEMLSASALKQHEDHSALLTPLRNWRSLRDFLAQCRTQRSDQPAIPHLGMYLTDIVMVEESEPDPPNKEIATSASPTLSAFGNSPPTKSSQKNPLVNFARCRIIAGIIQEIQQFQSVPYKFVTVPAAQEFFRKIQVLPEAELDAFSSALLPPRRQDALELEGAADAESIPVVPAGKPRSQWGGNAPASASHVATPLVGVIQRHIVTWAQAYLANRFSSLSASTFGTPADSLLFGDMTLLETELTSYAILLRLQTSAADIHQLNSALAVSSKANKALLIVLLAFPADLLLAAQSSVEVVIADDMPQNAPCLFRSMQVPMYREARARSTGYNGSPRIAANGNGSGNQSPHSPHIIARSRTSSVSRASARVPASALSSENTSVTEQCSHGLPSSSSSTSLQKTSSTIRKQMQEQEVVPKSWAQLLKDAGLEEKSPEVLPLLEREGLTVSRIIEFSDDDLKELGLKVGHVMKIGKRRDEILKQLGRPPLSNDP